MVIEQSTNTLTNAAGPAVTWLGFRLPDFTRHAWVSDAARSVWEPRIARVTAMLHALEQRSVATGLRSAALLSIEPQQLVERCDRAAEDGLVIVPVARQGASNQPYSSRPTPLHPGRSFSYRAALGRPEAALQLREAYAHGDDRAIAELLGYPSCCAEFFTRVWVEQQRIDTSWAMALNTPDRRSLAEDQPRTLVCKGPPAANILLRWLGVRAVFHLPCSFACEATVARAAGLRECAATAGFAEELGWLDEMLAWPVEWSALHGVAEIKTPVIKTSTATDASGEKLVVRWLGHRFPDEGADGVTFPYRTPEYTLLTSKSAFARGLSNPIAEPRPAWYASDNGFPSESAQRSAHRPIVRLALALLPSHGAAEVLDLGCGNAALLAALVEQRPELIVHGLEREPERIAHARALLPELADNFQVGDMFDDSCWIRDRPWDLVLLMPGRLLEVDADRARTLRTRLRQHARDVLVYAYGDWLERYGNLAELCARAGLRLLSATPDVPVGLARVS